MNVDSVIRKYFYDQLSVEHPVFDSRQGSMNVDKCYLITSQTKDKTQDTKCNYAYQTAIEIEIMSRSGVTGNTQSKLIVEEMENFVENAFDNINLSNFAISEKRYNAESFDADISADNKNRKVILINLKLE